MNPTPLTCAPGHHWLVELDPDGGVTLCQCRERSLPGMHTVYYQVAHYHPDEYTPYGYEPHVMENTECECHPDGATT